MVSPVAALTKSFGSHHLQLPHTEDTKRKIATAKHEEAEDIKIMRKTTKTSKLLFGCCLTLRSAGSEMKQSIATAYKLSHIFWAVGWMNGLSCGVVLALPTVLRNE